MILRPLQPPSPEEASVPAWSVVERLQRQKYDSCWMITQPSHAALSGEFAEKLCVAQLPRLQADLVRAIALHDAGWGVPDAQAIMQTRAANHRCPRSFIDCTVSEFLLAWEKSIDIAAGIGPAGGWVVSRHFHRLAQQRLSHSADNQSDRAKLTRFVEDESRRQSQLAAKQERGPAELERLADVLQFCDLLSLYVCSGARSRAEFPEYFGMKVHLTVEGETYRLDPPVLEPGTKFMVAALRHPATQGISGQQITLTVI
jgi:hypothetical protein